MAQGGQSEFMTHDPAFGSAVEDLRGAMATVRSLQEGSLPARLMQYDLDAARPAQRLIEGFLGILPVKFEFSEDPYVGIEMAPSRVSSKNSVNMTMLAPFGVFLKIAEGQDAVPGLVIGERASLRARLTELLVLSQKRQAKRNHPRVYATEVHGPSWESHRAQSLGRLATGYGMSRLTDASMVDPDRSTVMLDARRGPEEGWPLLDSRDISSFLGVKPPRPVRVARVLRSQSRPQRGEIAAHNTRPVNVLGSTLDGYGVTTRLYEIAAALDVNEQFDGLVADITRELPEYPPTGVKALPGNY